MEAEEAQPVADTEQEPEDDPTAEEAGEDARVDEVVTATPRGTPRDAIRRYGLENADVVERFFADVLDAEQNIWLSCPSCKKRSEVAVPNWSARTRALELMLSEGWGRPEASPPDDDEKLKAVVREELSRLTDEHLEWLGGLQDHQQRLLALPMEVQQGLAFHTDDELAEIAAECVEPTQPV